MRYRNLGKSRLQVSALCLGTMMFADQTELAEARNITAHAREHGVNFIDTADLYSTGKSETMDASRMRGEPATPGHRPHRPSVRSNPLEGRQVQ